MEAPGIDIATKIIFNLYGGIPKAIKYYKRRVKGLRFAVFGYRHTGKTTFIDRLRGKKTGFTYPPEPTAPGMHRVNNFEMTLISAEGINVKHLYDVPGDEAAWEKDWVPFFIQKQPRGVIVLIDHENVASNRAAVRFVIEMIQHTDPWWRLFKRRRGVAKARKKLKAFLLLVNKEDLWKGQMTLDDIMLNYRAEIQDLDKLMERLGVWYDIRACSAKYGHGVNEAMRDFVAAVLD